MEDLSKNGPILLFDGECNLCNRAVQWILARDKKGVFRFASLQSAVGQGFLKKFDLAADDFDTAVLVDGDRIFTRSSAALEICARLGGAWQFLAFLKIIPLFLRDAAYDWVARNRFRWFGKQTETCWIPRPEWKVRFL